MRPGPSQTQSVVRRQLNISARADRPSPLRDEEHIAVWADDTERRWIECLTINNGAVIHSVPPEVDEKGGMLSKRPAETADVFLQKERRLLLRIRVPGIPEVV